MAHELDFPKENPPKRRDNAAVAVGLTLAGAALIYFLLMQDAGAAPAKKKPVDTGPVVGDDDLYVSEDCKTVIEGKNWWLGWVKEKVTEAVYAGMGGPLLSNDPNVLNRSMNVVVRNLLMPWTPCGNQMPWPDWYVADHPVPEPKQGQNRAAFYAQMDAHRDAFLNDELVPSIKTYPKLNQLIGKLSTGVLAVYLDRYHFDPDNLDGTDEGGSVGKLSAQQKTRLLKMGYNITDDVIELFQSHFNVVMGEWVGAEWYGASMDIEPNNEMNNATDDALAFAYRSSVARSMPWQALVAQATDAGPDGEPPKVNPNA